MRVRLAAGLVAIGLLLGVSNRLSARDPRATTRPARHELRPLRPADASPEKFTLLTSQQATRQGTVPREARAHGIGADRSEPSEGARAPRRLAAAPSVAVVGDGGGAARGRGEQ